MPPDENQQFASDLRAAITHHQAGRLAEAERLYRAALQRNPRHGIANHNLGIIAAQSGKPADGLPHFKAAVDAEPDEARFWHSYARALVHAGRASDAAAAVEHATARGIHSAALQNVKQEALVGTITAATHYAPLIQLFQSGRHAEAEAHAREMLATDPAQGFAWKVLGASQAIQGKDALYAMTEAVRLLPNDADAHNNLGNALHAAGDFTAASQCYAAALALMPGYAEAHANLGRALHARGRHSEAIEHYRQAIALRPEYSKAYNYLGNVLVETGQLEAGIESYGRALAQDDRYADAHANLSHALRVAGRLDAALQHGEAAVGLDARNAVAQCNLGNVLQAMGRLDESVAAYLRAIDFDPAFAEAHVNLGSAHQALGQLDASVVAFRRAISLAPGVARRHAQLASALHERGDDDAAEAEFRRALTLDDGLVDAYTGLAQLQRDIGAMESAVENYRRAMLLEPNAFEHAIHHYLLQPIISDSNESIETWRQRYRDGLDALAAHPGTLAEPGERANPGSFHLAYHNRDNRALLESLQGVFRTKVPALNFTSPPSGIRPTGSRIRVVFVSEFFCEHTIGKLYEGFIAHLDRHRFEVVLVTMASARRDETYRRIAALADEAVILPVALAGQQQTVAALKADVLFYPDIGMAPSTYFLAYARLAPIQVASWGHPDTTGLSSIDYFVSTRSIEAEGAEAHYTERLVMLSRLPYYYPKPVSSVTTLSRATLGLPPSGTLYGCPQTLFKFHPEFDAVLDAIAAGDPDGHIILLHGIRGGWVRQLQARWRRTYPRLADRVRFLPRLNLEQFLAMVSHIDVLLDPLHYGSGNTMYEAMVHGTPVVSWPGQFARARLVRGAYEQMGIEDAPVISRVEDYVPMVLTLGRDPARRHALREASRCAADEALFSDMRVVRELETFFEAAVEAESNGKKLPTGWMPISGKLPAGQP